jgi:hypothetical protein
LHDDAPVPPPEVRVIDVNGVYFADDVRRIFGLKNSSLRREIRLGRLRVARRCGRYVFLGEWLIQWVRDGEVARRRPTAAPATTATFPARTRPGGNGHGVAGRAVPDWPVEP